MSVRYVTTIELELLRENRLLNERIKALLAHARHSAHLTTVLQKVLATALSVDRVRPSNKVSCSKCLK